MNQLNKWKWINHIARSFHQWLQLFIMLFIFNLHISVNSSNINISFYQLIKSHHYCYHYFCFSHTYSPESECKFFLFFRIHLLDWNDVSSVHNSRHDPKIVFSVVVEVIEFFSEFDVFFERFISSTLWLNSPAVLPTWKISLSSFHTIYPIKIKNNNLKIAPIFIISGICLW